VRRDGDGLHHGEASVGRRVPRVRQEAHHHRAHRLRAVLRAAVDAGASLMVRVKLPTLLRANAGGEALVEGKGDTLREVFDDLESRYPGITQRIVTEDGGLQRFVNVYLNDEDVRYLGSLETEVGEGDTVAILPAVAGGTG